MAVSTIKCCLSKFSARIRDYIDAVDSYYRPPDSSDNNDDSNASRLNDVMLHLNASSDNQESSHNRHHHHNIRSNTCDRANSKYKRGNNHHGRHHHHHHHHHHHSKPKYADLAPHLKPQFADFADSMRKLPPGFTRRKTSQGQIYFMDANGQKYWHDPSVPKELLAASLNLDSLLGELPPPWEIRQTPSGKTYYVNHSRLTTQFTDPRLLPHKEFLMGVLKHDQNSGVGLNSTKATTSDSLISPSRQQSRGTSPPCNNEAFDSSTLTLTADTHSKNRILGTCECRPRRQLSPRAITSATSNNNHNVNNDDRPHAHRNLSSKHNRSQLFSAISNRVQLSSMLPSNANCNNNQYRRNLFSGSHQNLTCTSTNSQKNPSTSARAGWIIPPRAVPVSKTNSNNEASMNLQRQQHEQTSTLPTNATNNQDFSCSLLDLSNIIARSNGSRELLTNNHQDDCLQSRNNKDLSDKISILRQELLKQQVITHPCKIDINRKRIFEESFRVISQMQPRDLRKRLLVKFRGEEGLDYGGVAREWFYLLSREILNPVHGLFQYTSDDIYNLQINPDSGIVYREHLSYMNFCGRIIGMAVFHGHFIEGHFTLPFYKMLLKKPISLGDIENVDPDLYRSLCWILENDITGVIDTTFLVQHNAFGQLQEHELKDNGRNINVTESNKHEYVSLYVNYRCRRGIEKQFEALLSGFNELISPSLVESFDEYELELLIGGLSKINMDDWRSHTKLKNCTLATPLVRWFWDIVKSYSEERRARLLQFVTGSPRVPIQGFKALQGVNSELRLFTIHLIRNASTDNLPKSHTCFNRIDLPPYESYDKLYEKLTKAIEETMGFAMQ